MSKQANRAQRNHNARKPSLLLIEEWEFEVVGKRVRGMKARRRMVKQADKAWRELGE